MRGCVWRWARFEGDPWQVVAEWPDGLLTLAGVLGPVHPDRMELGPLASPAPTVSEIRLCEVRRLVLREPLERYRITIDPACKLCRHDAGMEERRTDEEPDYPDVVVPSLDELIADGTITLHRGAVDGHAEADVDARIARDAEERGVSWEEQRAYAQALRDAGE